MSKESRRLGVQQIFIEAFRGVGEPQTIEFGDSGASVLLFGENGAGKSSIVDAIEFALAGTLGTAKAIKRESGCPR